MPNRDLKEQLRLLCDLQELDLKILSLNEKLALLPTKITKFEENLEVREQTLEADRLEARESTDFRLSVRLAGGQPAAAEGPGVT